MNTKNEPVALVAGLNAALIATVNLLGFLLDWSADTIAAINLAVGAWVGFASLLVRQFVTPNQNVALTNDDVALIEAGEADGT